MQNQKVMNSLVNPKAQNYSSKQNTHTMLQQKGTTLNENTRVIYTTTPHTHTHTHHEIEFTMNDHGYWLLRLPMLILKERYDFSSNILHHDDINENDLARYRLKELI